MATATCTLSSQTVANNGHSEFTTTFIPPINCSGRSCYLKVTAICPMVTQGTSLSQFVTYFVTMDLPQPFSYASINNSINPVLAVGDKRLVVKDRKSQVVGMFTTGGVGVAGGGGSGGFQTITNTSFPRILVEIPDGPRDITVGIWKGYGNLGNALEQLSVMFELTPIDTDNELHLQI